jgi:hypothetical protein
MVLFPVWCNLKPKSNYVVHKKVNELKDKGREKKRGTVPFLPHSILPFLDCPSFRTLFFWTTSMLFGCRCTKLGKVPSKMATSNYSIVIYGSEFTLKIPDSSIKEKVLAFHKTEKSTFEK